MAEASISVDQEQFSCSICLDLLKDPVTIHCGHSFCMVCINGCWDHNDQKGTYSCPQCRETFYTRPVLRRNNIMAEVVEKLKKTEHQVYSTAECHSQPGDVECDFCTRRKRKAMKSCMMCLVSLCETHLKPHYELPALKKHKLVKVSSNLQDKICSQHDEVIKIYCRTDQSYICYLCTMDKHKGHDAVVAAAERTEKQKDLQEIQKKCQQRLQEKQKKVEDVKEAIQTYKSSAQAAVEDTERIFTELMLSIEKRRSEVTELIRDQEKAELSQAEALLEQLEKEVADLKRRDDELKQFLHTEDHIHFLQSFPSLCDMSGSEDSSGITTNQHFTFSGIRNLLTDLKERLEEFCWEEFPTHVTDSIILLPEPQTRDDFLKYYCKQTLDLNTAHPNLNLCQRNRTVTFSESKQPYPDHPKRFDYWNQVLCKESVCGRSYWEIEWSTGQYILSISVSYKGIKRKGQDNACRFGSGKCSWSLDCSSTLSFWHNSIETKIPAPPTSRIGVYVDHSAGTLSFYSVSDTMTLLHRVQTTFTQPLHAGFWIGGEKGTIELCDPK